MQPMMMKADEIDQELTEAVRDTFSTDVTGLGLVTSTKIVEVADGGSFNLRAEPVRKQLGDADVRMLAYNGSIPGPTLRVKQRSEVRINFTNHTDLETTVHWHGLRLDHRFDGVPQGTHGGMQAPIAPGRGFAYKLRFPDPGVYWYHPHIREDYTQELGMYGNIIVAPSDPEYWSPVNRELVLVLDDILLQGDKVAPFSKSESNRTAMGRYGNVMLVNGQTDFSMAARRG